MSDISSIIMNEGDIVVCVYTDSVLPTITVGKKYTVLKVSHSDLSIRISNDNFVIKAYYKYLFKTLPEYREHLLNQLGV
jgi:hypothetical protein